MNEECFKHLFDELTTEEWNDLIYGLKKLNDKEIEDLVTTIIE